jgi:hypothetical protein
LTKELSVYAKWQFWAAGYDKGSKVSRLQNLKQIEKSIGQPPKQLAERPKLRSELDYLWGLFVSLKNASEGAISYNQIKSYMDIYGDLTAFEVDLIRELDQLSYQEAYSNG